MNATPLRRLPPGTWTALAWSAAMAYSMVVSIRLPGEVPQFRPSEFAALSSTHVPFVVVATVLALAAASCWAAGRCQPWRCSWPGARSRRWR